MNEASLLRRNRREELHPARFLSDTERDAEDDGATHTLILSINEQITYSHTEALVRE